MGLYTRKTKTVKYMGLLFSGVLLLIVEIFKILSDGKRDTFFWLSTGTFKISDPHRSLYGPNW